MIKTNWSVHIYRRFVLIIDLFYSSDYWIRTIRHSSELDTIVPLHSISPTQNFYYHNHFQLPLAFLRVECFVPYSSWPTSFLATSPLQLSIIGSTSTRLTSSVSIQLTHLSIMAWEPRGYSGPSFNLHVGKVKVITKSTTLHKYF